MSPMIIIAILIGLPLLLSFAFRVNAGVIFLALCAGSVLSQFVADDTNQLASSFFARTNQNIVTSAVQITLLLLPAVLTMLFMRNSMKGTKILMNLIPAAAAGLLTALLVVPLLPPGTRYAVTGSEVWSTLQNFQSVIIGAGVFVSLLMLWSSKPKHDKHKKHHKK
jgi:hypothetical protein